MAKKTTTMFTAYSKLDFSGQRTDLPEKDIQLPIQGFGIHEGRFNEIINIEESEFGNIEKTMPGAQLRVDHSDSVRDVVGTVTFAEAGFDSNAQKPGVFYRALIDDDDDVARKVNKGLIKDVSIGFELYPECSVCHEDFRTCEHWFDEASINARDIKVHELSIVTRGADADAKASVQSFKAQFNDKLDKNSLKKDKKELSNNDDGGKIMADKQKDNSYDIGDIVAQLKESEKTGVQKDNEIEQLRAKLAAQKEELEKAQSTLAQEKEAKENLETEKAQLQEKADSVSSKLSAKELSDKQAEVLSIVETEIEKELTAEENKDARVAELMEVENLGVVKDLVSKFQKVEKNEQEIGELNAIGKIKIDKQKFAATQGLDYEDPKVKQGMVQWIFKYDRVFKGERKDNAPQHSYMGFKKNNLEVNL